MTISELWSEFERRRLTITFTQHYDDPPNAYFCAEAFLSTRHGIGATAEESIADYLHTDVEPNLDDAPKMFDWLRTHGVYIWVDPETGEYIPLFQPQNMGVQERVLFLLRIRNAATRENNDGGKKP
jgi:hypothetical protein